MSGTIPGLLCLFCNAVISLDAAENVAQDVWAIYPNPVYGSDLMTVVTRPDRQAHLRIMEVTGRVVQQQELSGGTEHISLNGLATGSYLAEVAYPESVSTRIIQIIRQ